MLGVFTTSLEHKFRKKRKRERKEGKEEERKEEQNGWEEGKKEGGGKEERAAPEHLVKHRQPQRLLWPDNMSSAEAEKP